MNLILRLFGVGLILACGIFASHEYSEYVKMKISALKNLPPDELEAETERAEKNIKVARALLIGGALALGVMVI